MSLKADDPLKQNFNSCRQIQYRTFSGEINQNFIPSSVRQLQKYRQDKLKSASAKKLLEKISKGIKHRFLKCLAQREERNKYSQRRAQVTKDIYTKMDAEATMVAMNNRNSKKRLLHNKTHKGDKQTAEYVRIRSPQDVLNEASERRLTLEAKHLIQSQQLKSNGLRNARTTAFSRYFEPSELRGEEMDRELLLSLKKLNQHDQVQDSEEKRFFRADRDWNKKNGQLYQTARAMPASDLQGLINQKPYKELYKQIKDQSLEETELRREAAEAEATKRIRTDMQYEKIIKSLQPTSEKQVQPTNQSGKKVLTKKKSQLSTRSQGRGIDFVNEQPSNEESKNDTGGPHESEQDREEKTNLVRRFKIKRSRTSRHMKSQQSNKTLRQLSGSFLELQIDEVESSKKTFIESMEQQEQDQLKQPPKEPVRRSSLKKKKSKPLQTARVMGGDKRNLAKSSTLAELAQEQMLSKQMTQHNTTKNLQSIVPAYLKTKFLSMQNPNESKETISSEKNQTNPAEEQTSLTTFGVFSGEETSHRNDTEMSAMLSDEFLISNKDSQAQGHPQSKTSVKKKRNLKPRASAQFQLNLRPSQQSEGFHQTLYPFSSGIRYEDKKLPRVPEFQTMQLTERRGTAIHPQEQQSKPSALKTDFLSVPELRSGRVTLKNRVQLQKQPSQISWYNPATQILKESTSSAGGANISTENLTILDEKLCQSQLNMQTHNQAERNVSQIAGNEIGFRRQQTQREQNTSDALKTKFSRKKSILKSPTYSQSTGNVLKDFRSMKVLTVEQTGDNALISQSSVKPSKLKKQKSLYRSQTTRHKGSFLRQNTSRKKKSTESIISVNDDKQSTWSKSVSQGSVQNAKAIDWETMPITSGILQQAIDIGKAEEAKPPSRMQNAMRGALEKICQREINRENEADESKERQGGWAEHKGRILSINDNLKSFSKQSKVSKAHKQVIDRGFSKWVANSMTSVSNPNLSTAKPSSARTTKEQSLAQIATIAQIHLYETRNI